MSDVGMQDKPAFHAIAAKVRLSFGKLGNKSHQAIVTFPKTQHTIDHQKIAAQIFDEYWVSFFCQTAYFLQQRRICQM
jgi:hypothetical protein